MPSPAITGHRPRARTARLSLRVDTFISIRFMAQRPSQFLACAAVQVGSGISWPSKRRTRGRWTATLPPWKPILPLVRPQRWPRGLHRGYAAHQRAAGRPRIAFARWLQSRPSDRSARMPAHCPFRGLLGVHSRYGLHTRAVTVFRDTLSEGFSHFVTSIAAPVASGWSGCRVGFAPTGKRRLFTAHAKPELMHCSKFGRLCGAFNAHVDFAAERPEVDWLCQQRLSTVLQSLAFRLRIAIGGDHDDRERPVAVLWPWARVQDRSSPAC